MPDSIYLAMTAAELASAKELPKKLAYMACHFSPYGTGLSNFPDKLPPDSLLIVNDRTPMCGHDKELITQQLTQLLEEHQCDHILLDLQRPDDTENRSLTEYLCQALTGKVAVSHLYATDLSCPVFLPPLPVGRRLQDHIAPWESRELWLDVCCDAARITVTAGGSTRTALPCSPPEELPFTHDTLHCSYRTKVTDTHAEFTLRRTLDHIPFLLKEAASFGITRFIGLYQEFKTPRE